MILIFFSKNSSFFFPSFLLIALNKPKTFSLFLSFLIFPLVSSMAFRVWSCEEFENGSFMRADYSIKCSRENPEYASIVALALFGILLFPVGISLLYMVLFYQARQSILASKPTALSKVRSTLLFAPD